MDPATARPLRIEYLPFEFLGQGQILVGVPARRFCQVQRRTRVFEIREDRAEPPQLADQGLATAASFGAWQEWWFDEVSLRLGLGVRVGAVFCIGRPIPSDPALDRPSGRSPRRPRLTIGKALVVGLRLVYGCIWVAHTYIPTVGSATVTTQHAISHQPRWWRTTVLAWLPYVISRWPQAGAVTQGAPDDRRPGS